MCSVFYTSPNKLITSFVIILLASCTENAGVSEVSVESVCARSVEIKGVMGKRNGSLGISISDVYTDPLCSDSRIVTPIRIEKDRTFSALITGLKPATKYYYRVFSIRGQTKVLLSEVHSFTTDSFYIMPVDLGISVLWSNCNLGVDLPENNGDYLSWLESSNLAEESWRLPTAEEFDELCTQCKWKWTTLSGTWGYVVKSSNGNSIFLPAAGAMGGGNQLFGLSTNGAYWTSNRANYSRNEAMCLKFTSNYRDLYSEDDKYSFSIRLVRPFQ